LVTVNDTPYIIFNDNGNFLVYSKDGDYICALNDFEKFLSRYSYEDEFDEEF
jgi:hypothetical protein